MASLVDLRPGSSFAWKTFGTPGLMKATGQFYYEVMLESQMTGPQFGWVTNLFWVRTYNGKGVGDEVESWGIDGLRHMWWQQEVGPVPATWITEDWQPGDIVGLAVDIDNGTMQFSLNGVWDNGWYSFTKTGQELYPALSTDGEFTMLLPRNTWRYSPPACNYRAWTDSGTSGLSHRREARPTSANYGYDDEPIAPARTVDSLDEQARLYYKTFQVALNPGGEQTLNQMISKHYKQFDANNDGRLNLEETTALVTHLFARLTLPAPQPGVAATLFYSHDTDSSGYIELPEFTMLYRRILRKALSSLKVVGKTELIREARCSFEEKYVLGKRLAAGAQGVTFLATVKESGKTVVVKKPNNCHDTDDFTLLVEKSHPNIVRVFELFHSEVETFVVMECCSGGDLFKGVATCKQEFGTITTAFVGGVMEQVIAGVAYIHSEFRQVHNDLKPENVLLDRKPSGMSDVPRCMVADFGCAAAAGGAQNGDPRYNSPQVFFGGEVTFKTDVWALGMMLYELLSGGILAFTDELNISGWGAWYAKDNHRLFHKFQKALGTQGAQPNWDWIAYDVQALSLVQGMLAYERHDRMELNNVACHPWFESVKGESQALPPELGETLNKRAVHSDLKMALLNLVTSKLQGESLQYYNEIWQKFDTDHSGTLETAEFMKVLQELGMDQATAYEVKLVADVDGSGKIDFNEFTAVVFNKDVLTEEQFEEHFASIFVDLAGSLTEKITADQLSSVFSDGMSAGLIQRLFDEIDVDGNGKVDYAEFKDFVSKM